MRSDEKTSFSVPCSSPKSTRGHLVFFRIIGTSDDIFIGYATRIPIYSIFRFAYVAKLPLFAICQSREALTLLDLKPQAVAVFLFGRETNHQFQRCSVWTRSMPISRSCPLQPCSNPPCTAAVPQQTNHAHATGQ